MKQNSFHAFLSLLNRLEQTGISYHLAHHRDDALMIVLAVPGERWEVEFLEDGSIEIERFISNGEILNQGALEQLFVIYRDQVDEQTLNGHVTSGQTERVFSTSMA